MLGALPATQATFLLILVATLVRVGFAAGLGLGIDESYMVATGRHLALGYFDHPPAAWWMQWGAAHLFGTWAPLAVRAPFIAAFALSTWLMFRLGCAVADARAGLLAAIALNLSPVFGVTTGTWVLPDGPLDCALLGAALCFVHALEARGWRWWIGTGLCAGLALFSKYNAVLVIAGALIFLIATAPGRRWLRRPQPYVAGLLALAVFAPVIGWNAVHHWASFAFQGGRADRLTFRPAQPFVVLAGEALFVLPWIWLGMAIAVWRALTRRARARRPLPEGEVTQPPRRPLPEKNVAQPPLPLAGEAGARSAPGEGARLLIYLGAPAIVFFCLVALFSRTHVLFHWAAPGYLMLFPLLGAWLAGRPKLAVRSVAATTAFVLCALAFVVAGVRTDFLHPAFAALHVRDPEAKAIDWTSLRTDLAARGLLTPGTVVAVANWRDGGKIAYALGPRATVVCLDTDAREFGFEAPSATFVGHTMLLLVVGDGHATANRVRPAFATLQRLPPAEVRMNGTALLPIAVFRGTGFRGWPPR